MDPKLSIMGADAEVASGAAAAAGTLEPSANAAQSAKADAKAAAPAKDDRSAAELKPAAPTKGEKPAGDAKAAAPGKGDKPGADAKAAAPAKDDKAAADAKAAAPGKGDKPAADNTKAAAPAKDDKPAADTKAAAPGKGDKSGADAKAAAPGKGDKPAADTKAAAPAKDEKAAADPKAAAPAATDKPAPDSKAPATAKPAAPGKPAAKPADSPAAKPAAAGKPAHPPLAIVPGSKGSAAVAAVPAPESAPAPVPLPRTDAAAAARALRHSRARKLGMRLLLGVVLPTALAGVYYGLIASDRFESVSLFTIHSADGSRSLSLETLVGGMPGSAATRDTLAARDYILSRDMLQLLDKEHGFIAHFKSRNADWLSRLDSDASFEEAYEDYQDRVRVEYDSTSGVLDLRVQAFDAASAKKFADAILHAGEQLVNQLSERARRDQIDFASREVASVEQRLATARQKVLELQRERGEFNPEQAASAALSIRSGLEAELAKARAELMQAQAFMRTDSPNVMALSERVKALTAQVSKENRRLVSPNEGSGLNDSIAEFESTVIEKEFAQRAYQSALTSLEVARSEAARQHRYLAVIAAPSVADEATHPRRWLGVLTVFVCSFLLLGIGSLLVAAVKEHGRL